MSTLVGKKAPDFSAQAAVKDKIVNHFSLSSMKGKYVLLFFYPLDFTFVCPTELHAFQDRLQEFRERECELVGCSIDSAYCHLAWLRTPRNEGGIQGVEYPIIADVNKTISQNYEVLIPHEGIAYRGLFLIDQEGIVRHVTVNDLPLGRSVDEALRILDALIYFERNGEVCPANWNHGRKAMQPTSEGLKQYFAMN